MSILTYATHSFGNFDEMIDNDYGVQFIILGWGKKWEGYMGKLKMIHEYCKKLKDDDIVIPAHINGYKISKIARLSPHEVTENVHNLTINKSADDWSIGLFKLAMINFDQRLFTKTFNELLEQFSFREIFKNVFIFSHYLF